MAKGRSGHVDRIDQGGLMLDQFQNLKRPNRVASGRDSKRVAVRPGDPSYLGSPHRVQGQNVNTGTPASPFFYSVYSQWHSIIHQRKLGFVSLDPGRSRL